MPSFGHFKKPVIEIRWNIHHVKLNLSAVEREQTFCTSNFVWIYWKDLINRFAFFIVMPKCILVVHFISKTKLTVYALHSHESEIQLERSSK